jgi:hypothetical protein
MVGFPAMTRNPYSAAMTKRLIKNRKQRLYVLGTDNRAYYLLDLLETSWDFKRHLLI